MARNTGDKNVKTARSQLVAFQARQDAHEKALSRRKRDNVMWALIAGVIVVAALGSQIGFTLTGSGAAATHSSASGPNTLPDPAVANSQDWNLALGINNVALAAVLDGAGAPQAVSSTIVLAQRDFYKNLTCHRLTTSGIFVLQCGDPSGDGTGGPGYSYGPIENAPQGDLYPAGTIAMARQSSNSSSQGSQFFIVYKDSVIPSDSAGGYTVIGRITDGLPTLIANIVSGGTSDGSTDGSPAIKSIISKFAVQAAQ